MAYLVLIVVTAIYGAAIAGVITVTRWQRKTRWPFKLEDRLVRGPGEQLRRRIAELDEQFMWNFIGGLMVILLAMALTGDFLRRFSNLPPTTAAWFAVLVGTVVGSVGLWRIRGIWRKRANCHLGWFGERIVGEQLQLATVHGWRVFHDLPFQNNGAYFNIDHVAVGPGGVFLIETKTRRKGRARPGFDDDKAYFDGRDLVWPWGEDNHGLEQAERNALWLTNWIRTEIGERVHISPILALPGWWLEMKPSRESRLCQVVNPKWLPKILAKQPTALSPKQIELIALRLEARCRDVED